jgi:integrase
MLKLPLVVLNKSKIDEIVDACDLTATGDRDAALIQLIFGSGLRVTEALALTPDDIDAERNILYVRNGKGGKSRTVVASKDAMDAIIPYVNSTKRGEKIFVISDSAVRKRMRRLAKRMSMPRLHAHSLRHAHAVELARNGVSINHIQQQLGHSNIGTTSLYLQRYNPDERMLAISAALNGGK